MQCGNMLLALALLASIPAAAAPPGPLHPEMLADPAVRASVRLTPKQEARARAVMREAERSLAREERERPALKCVAMSRDSMVAARARSGLAALRLSEIQRRRLDAAWYRRLGPGVLSGDSGALRVRIGLSRRQALRIEAAQAHEVERADRAVRAYIRTAKPPMERRKWGMEPKRTPEIARIEAQRDLALWRVLYRGLTAPQRQRLSAILYPDGPKR